MENTRSGQFDGLRSYAAALIIASHTKAFHMPVGQTMVALFFTISGFFAAAPFSRKPNIEESYIKPGSWFRFYLQRAARILPIYWIVHVFAMLLSNFKGKTGSFDVFLKSAFLIEANGHLWYVQNQIVIYLFVPFFFLIALLMKRHMKIKKVNILCGLAFILLGFCLHWFFKDTSRFYLFGNGRKQYLRIGLFTIGFGFGYFAREMRNIVLSAPYQKHLADAVELLILLAGAFVTPFYLEKVGMAAPKFNAGTKYPLVCSMIAGALLLLLLVNRDGLVARVLSFPPIRAIGEASFTVYLVQSFLNRQLSVSPAEAKWLVSVIASSGIGYMSYNLFEKPFYARIKDKLARLST